MKRVARKPTGAMKKFLEVDKYTSRIMGPIDQHLMTVEGEPRSSTVLHPSEMCSDDWCHRESYWLLRGKEKPVEQHSAHLERIFEEGHAIHRKYQTWLSDMGCLYGTWKCLNCLWTQPGVGPGSLMACKRCNSVVMEYAEVSLRSEPHRISGHADGWVLDHGDPFLIEIKSVGVGTLRFEAPQLLAEHGKDYETIWKEIRRPFKKHRLQGQLYLSLLELQEQQGNLVLPAGYKRPEEMVFIYEFKANQQTKEFVVAHDNESVAPLLNTAREIVYAVEKQRPVECNISPGGCPKCKPYEEE